MLPFSFFLGKAPEWQQGGPADTRCLWKGALTLTLEGGRNGHRTLKWGGNVLYWRLFTRCLWSLVPHSKSKGTASPCCDAIWHAKCLQKSNIFRSYFTWSETLWTWAATKRAIQKSYILLHSQHLFTALDSFSQKLWAQRSRSARQHLTFVCLDSAFLELQKENEIPWGDEALFQKSKVNECIQNISKCRYSHTLFPDLTLTVKTKTTWC